MANEVALKGNLVGIKSCIDYPSCRGVFFAIDTQKEKVSLCFYRERNSQCLWKHKRKHVGEMDAEELAHTLLDSSTRNILQLQVNDIDKTNRLFQDLYGKAVEPRVKFILEHSEEARVE